MFSVKKITFWSLVCLTAVPQASFSEGPVWTRPAPQAPNVPENIPFDQNAIKVPLNSYEARATAEQQAEVRRQKEAEYRNSGTPVTVPTHLAEEVKARVADPDRAAQVIDTMGTTPHAPEVVEQVLDMVPTQVPATQVADMLEVVAQNPPPMEVVTSLRESVDDKTLASEAVEALAERRIQPEIIPPLIRDVSDPRVKRDMLRAAVATEAPVEAVEGVTQSLKANKIQNFAAAGVLENMGREMQVLDTVLDNLLTARSIPPGRPLRITVREGISGARRNGQVVASSQRKDQIRPELAPEPRVLSKIDQALSFIAWYAQSLNDRCGSLLVDEISNEPIYPQTYPLLQLLDLLSKELRLVESSEGRITRSDHREAIRGTINEKRVHSLGFALYQYFGHIKFERGFDAQGGAAFAAADMALINALKAIMGLYPLVGMQPCDWEPGLCAKTPYEVHKRVEDTVNAMPGDIRETWDNLKAAQLKSSAICAIELPLVAAPGVPATPPPAGILQPAQPSTIRIQQGNQTIEVNIHGR